MDMIYTTANMSTESSHICTTCRVRTHRLHSEHMLWAAQLHKVHSHLSFFYRNEETNVQQPRDGDRLIILSSSGWARLLGRLVFNSRFLVRPWAFAQVAIESSSKLALTYHPSTCRFVLGVRVCLCRDLFRRGDRLSSFSLLVFPIRIYTPVSGISHFRWCMITTRHVLRFLRRVCVLVTLPTLEMLLQVELHHGDRLTGNPMAWLLL